MAPLSKKQILNKVRHGSKQAKDATLLRDHRIREALDLGMSIREVAAAADLSPARIHQIRHGK